MDVQRRYVIAKFEIRVDTIENNLELDIVIGGNFFRFNNLRLGYIVHLKIPNCIRLIRPVVLFVTNWIEYRPISNINNTPFIIIFYYFHRDNLIKPGR